MGDLIKKTVIYIYEDGSFETQICGGKMGLVYIKSYMAGLDCSDHSENIINRKYCFRRIDFDVQNFSESFLTKKLCMFEVSL